MNITQLTIAAGVLLCAGCSPSPIITSKIANNVEAGLVYALPKGQVQLDVVRKVVTEDDVKVATKVVESAKTALDAANARLKDATEARDAAQHEVDALTKDNKTAEREKLEFRLVLATVMLRARTAEVAVAKTQLAEAAKHLSEAQRNINQMEQKVTLKPLPVIADSSRRYVAQLQSSLFRDDSIKLSVNNGLLNTTTSESTGQVGNILVSLVSAIAGARGGGTAIPSIRASVSEFEGEQKKPCEPFAHTWIFDPTDQGEVDQVSNDITRRPSLIKLTRPEQSSTSGPAPSGSNKNENQQKVSGLAYRVPVTVTVEVQFESSSKYGCEVSSTDSYASLTTTLPDSRTTYSASVDGASFTKTKTEYAFKDGMPISFSSDQPSQAAAVARIPVEILKAIIEVPASILKLRVDYDSQAAALTKQHTDQLKAQVDLINAQNALDEARQQQIDATP